jgi:DNA invertase Pin-like site-specific DNA recombinase
VDRSGEERSITEQHTDNVQAAAENGFMLGEPYKDTGSASSYARKGRKGFTALVADLEQGRFDADILVLWELSRGSRQMEEWLPLVNRCEDAGVRIYVTRDDRLYDPRRDRYALLGEALGAEKASKDTSDRVRRTLRANAAQGRPHGQIPFGFRREYDTRGKPTGQYPDPVEAPLVRELFNRVQAGHSLKAISRDWADRGITGRRGRPMVSTTLRGMLVHRAYVGERETAGSVVPGTWDKIVSPSVYWNVQRLIGSPERKTSRPGRVKYPFTYVLRCDRCSGPITVRYRPGDIAEYQCHDGGHVRIAAEGVDKEVTDALIAYLSREDVYQHLSAVDGESDGLNRVRDELAEARVRLDSLRDAVVSGEVSVAALGRAEPKLMERITDLETAERELSTPSALAGLLPPQGQVEQWWNAAEVSTRRAVAALLLTPGLMGEVRITRSAEPGVAVPAVDRLVWRRIAP